jgi:DNA topoisomerase IA
MRVLFTAQDSQTIRDAFDRAKANAEYARLYAAAVARRQADQIYNLSLTRGACRKLNPGILVMQSAQDWVTKNVPDAIDGARDRCIFRQG